MSYLLQGIIFSASLFILPGGPEDIITSESGYLIQPGNINKLAEKMKELYEHYEQFDKKAIRQSIANRFDFRLAGQKLKEIYEL